MTRTLRALLVAALVPLAVMTQLTPAQAVTDRQLREARQHYQQVQGELNRIAKAYADQVQKGRVLSDKIDTTNQAISKTSGRAAQLQARLRDRVRTAYRMGGLGFFEFMFSAVSFRDFSLRAILLERQSSHDEDLMLELGRVHSRLSAEKKTLKTQRRQQLDLMSSLRQRAGQLDAAFGTAQALLARLDDEKRAEELARFFRTHPGEAANGRAIPLSRCPAAGPHAFSNDWHAPRGGGTRLHMGNDIFAPMGSPAVATVSGTITRHGSGGLGGLSIYLYGDDGIEFYYAHMSGFATDVGVHVSAGQTIGYVGNTGDARGGPTHIHFQVQPGGGAPINPYPSLIRVC